MSSIAKTAKIFVGVDVSKATLDVYRPDTKEFLKIENSDEAISVLCSQLEKKKRQVMVVMEGTGGYEYLLLRQLANHKLAAAVINPRRVRDFAKGIGLDAKTDPIDAKVISTYAEVVVPKPMATKSEHELKHSALVARRSQLLELINQENNRLKQSWDDDAKQRIRDVLEVLKKQLKSAGCFWHKCLQGTVLTRGKLKSFSPSKELER